MRTLANATAVILKSTDHDPDARDFSGDNCAFVGRECRFLPLIVVLLSDRNSREA